MLPWIQVYSNLPEHPKIYALVDRLKLRRNCEAVGIVVSLWLWAAKNAPDGDLSGFPDRAIAAAVGYPMNLSHKLCRTLIETGWLDADNSGGYRIHDWEDHASMLMDALSRQKAMARERSRRYRQRKSAAEQGLSPELGAEHHAAGDAAHHACDVTDHVADHAEPVTHHAPTRPDRTEPNHNHSSLSASSSSWSKESLSGIFSPRLELSASTMDELVSLADGMEETVVRRALDIAQDNGKLCWGYVKGILKNWQKGGVRTLAQVEEREAKRKGRGAPQGGGEIAAADVAESRRRMREILGE